MSDIHDNIKSLIAAYALGAVPEEEIPAIRAHILTCEDCFEEAESYAVAMAALSETVEPVSLSAGFEDRVLKAALGENATEKSPSAPRRRWFVPARSWVLAGAAALVVALFVAAGGVVVNSLNQQRQYEEALAHVVEDPDAFTLRGAGGAQAVLASTNDGSVLVALDLGEAPEGREYQLWLMRDGVPTPADTFDSSGSVVILESDREVEGFEGAAVTVEPEGGSKQPTTDPVLSTG